MAGATMRNFIIVLIIAFLLAYMADAYFYNGAYSGKLFDSLRPMILPITHYFR
jgi:hypothetical protein